MGKVRTTEWLKVAESEVKVSEEVGEGVSVCAWIVGVGQVRATEWLKVAEEVKVSEEVEEGSGAILV